MTKSNFKKNVNDLISKFKSIKGFKEPYNQKIKFVKAEREYTTFSFSIETSFDDLKDLWDMENKSQELCFFDACEKRFFEFCKSFSGIFVGEKTDFDFNDSEAFGMGKGGKYYSLSSRASFNVHNSNMDSYVQLGYIVESLNNIIFTVRIYFYGDKLELGSSFDKCPEIKPGTILAQIYGYNCTLCNFYIVRNRIGSTIAISSLDQCYASGDWMNGSVIPGNTMSREIEQKVIRDSLIKHGYGYLHVWNGKPQYVNCD